MLKKDVILTFIGNVLCLVLGLAISIVTARALGPHDRGLLALALLIPLTLATFVRFGQETVNVTFAGLYKDKRRSLFFHTLLCVVGGGILGFVAVMGFFLLPFPKGEFAALPPSVMVIASLYIPVCILMANIGNLVRGVGKVREAVLLTVLQLACNLVLMVLVLVVFRQGYIEALIVTTVSPLVTIGLSVWMLRDVVTLNPRVFDWPLLKRSLGFGGAVAAADIGAFLIHRLDQGILGFMANSTQLGLYVVSVQLAERLRMLPNSIATSFLPRLTNQMAERQSQVPAVFRLTMVASVLAVVLSLLAGPPLVLLLFGREFAGAIVPFLILLPGVAMAGAASVTSGYLLAKGKPHWTAMITWSMAGLTVVLDLVFIVLMGIAGAALASTLCNSLACIWSVRLYCRESRTRWSDMVPRGADFRAVLVLSWQMLRRGWGILTRWGPAPTPAPDDRSADEDPKP